MTLNIQSRGKEILLRTNYLHPDIPGISRTAVRRVLMICCLAAALAFLSPAAYADEGGVSFWLPGQMGSFAAMPGDPGWSLPLIQYRYSGDAGAGKAFERGGQITAGLKANYDLYMLSPTYAFGTPVAGGQASLGLTGLFGSMNVNVNATLTGPGGGTLSGEKSDALNSVGDLYPMASLKWNKGNHNYMVYTMAGVPVGNYQKGKLANIGIGHWSIDGGAGYTYLNQKNGRELSAVAGVTYNFENTDTHYQNGIDGHLDWAASQFLSEHLHIGAVGYVYHQLTGDSGSGDLLGDFKSRVWAIGPQIGYLFKVEGRQWYANFKTYFESDAVNRTEGWNTWLTLVIPL
jgi:hypothetical protein